ncbi:Deoxycytidine kinase 1 [Kalmusia sp. IMI 367209]|nr:Deoxycytidine kinase 1 [Kalmusia sp. IMI 367209]
MPGWRPLPRIAFAICIYPFQPSSPADLPLEIGDELYVIEQGGKDGAWFRGYLVAPPSLLAGLTSVKGQTLEARVFSGIFPRCCVEVREVLGEGKNTPTPAPTPTPNDGAERRASHGEHTTNGVITPTESTGATPPSAKGAASHAKRVSRSDTVSALPTSATRPLSRRRSTKNRAGSHGSQWTARSDHLQQLALPLSPVSPTSHDPTAPRPPAPVPMLKIGDETPTSAQEPLVDEIASCLREWHSTKLHELLLARKYSALDKMSALVQRLDTARRQLLHKVLTVKELDNVREATVWDLVAGNKMLCGDVIVRSPSQRGRILTGDDSAIEVTKLQSMMSLLDGRPVPHIDEHNLHHLFVNLKQVMGDVVQSGAQVSMHLCLKVPGTAPMPLSEAYSFDLTTRDGTPVPLGEKLKSLLVDLSSTDIGEGAGSGSRLYLVFKLLTNEPIRPVVVAKENFPRDGTSGTSNGIQPSQYGSIKGGRRSVMFGSKRKESAHSSTSSVDARSTSVDTSRSQSRDGRPASSTVTKPRSNSKDQKTLKRTVAVGVHRVDQLVRTQSESDQNITLWSLPQPLDEVSEEDIGWDEFFDEIYPSHTGRYKKHPQISRITVHLKAFAHSDADTLIEKTPTLLHNIRMSRKIGFSGAPTKPRSDIYLTLSEAFLPKNAFLAHPKTGTVPLTQTSSMNNLQLTIEVRKQSGERIESCIYPSSNSAGHTAWRTTAVERGEKWNLTVRLAIKPEEVPGSHIVMSIADAPGFPFALCWMPLWTQDAFARDGDHALSLYRYDEYTSSMIAGKGAYLGLPWSVRKKDDQVMGPLASLHLRTFLCSTKYSQDPNLLGLLKWRDQAGGDLVGLLRRFPFVPEIEIVKLLSEVFEALFEILVEYAGSDEYEDLVFNALVIILGIVHDRRFNLAPLVDQYAETKFNYPFATACLVRSYTRLLTSPSDPDSSRRLRATFKVGRHILKFIMNARQQQKEKEAGIGITNRQPTFAKDIHAIFKSLELLMSNPSAILIGTKTILVQNFHLWLPELAISMTPMEILKLASSFIESCATASGKLILYKLLLIHHVGGLDLFKTPDTRRVLLSNIAKWLAPHWGKIEQVTDQWKDQVRLCCSVVASLVEELGQDACEYIPKLVDSYRAIQATPRPVKKNLSLLFPTTYPFPTRPTTTQAPFDEALIEISAVLAALSSLPIIIHLDWPKEDIASFLFSTLQVYISILDCEAFPSSWLSVHIFHHKATMRALEKLSGVLMDSFLPHPDEAEQFNTDLWRAFFDALLKLVGSDALALETFPEQKRRAVWKIAGDVRELGADLLQRSWEAIGWEASSEDKKQYGLEKMGGFQVQYVPGLVAPVVELCLSVHEGLRSVAIEVLQTMIVSEWTLSEDLSLIQAEMIDCLDLLFKSRPLTEVVLQKHFIQELVDLFEPLAQDPEEQLFTAVKNLITTIDELLDLLVAVHSTEATGEVFHIMDTLHLMEFLKDMQKEDMYIRYVHQLVQLQADAQNFTEAGLALRLHAELYEWDPTTIVDPLVDPAFPAQTSFERKEQLYFQMIDHYENGQSWDNALGSYMELATQYEHNVFDFAKLARTQHAMAKIYESIAKGERPNARYFRVVYKGLGFPVGLRDKHFIFEGSPNDRLATFTDRMQQQHPAAQILTAGMEQDVEGQYLQIFPVSAQKDLSHPIFQRAKVAQSIRDYYLLSRPSHFTTASRRTAVEGSSKEVTVEKTVYTTAESFPTILRRSEIIAVGTVTLTPLQTAIERTTRKTVELHTLEKRVSGGEELLFTELTRELMFAVDTTQETSVANYHELLPDSRRASMESEEIETHQEPNPLENALKVALVDYALVIRRCLALYTRPAQLATKTDLSQRLELAFRDELANLMPATVVQPVRSPTGSWLAAATSPSRVASPTSNPTTQVNGTKVTSPVPDARPARQDKKRMSLSFFGIGAPTSEGASQKSEKEHKPLADDILDTASTSASSRSRSKDGSKSKNRLSLSFISPNSPNSPVPEALPTFPSQPSSQHKLAQVQSRDQSIDGRPQTSKSIKSEKSEHQRRSSSVKKRLSNFYLGKKSSKASVRGHVDDTLEEE